MINKRAAKATTANLLRGILMVIGGFIIGCLITMVTFAVCYCLFYFVGPWSFILFSGSILVFTIIILIKDLVEYIRLDYQQNVKRFKDE